MVVNRLQTLFLINPQLDIPIYQQLVDKIRSDVKMGTLTPGQQLPTVQELSQELSIARGTIKRAYDELEHQGFIEKIQGRGTFICYRPANSGSRKEQAMAAIDEMLDKLEAIGFSPEEINIFLTLKQRERAEELSVLRVAAVECNPENLSQLSEQLRTIKGIDLYSYLVNSVEAYPYKLDEDMDLVVTTAEHAPFLETILPDRKKIALVALRLSLDTLSGLVKLRPGTKVGIMTYSSRFGDLLYDSCRKFAKNLSVEKPTVFCPELDAATFVKGKDMILVPKGYEKYCSTDTAKTLHTLAKKGAVVECFYEMDDGSCLHLEEKLQQLRKSKQIS